jgi:hypothetical protein
MPVSAPIVMIVGGVVLLLAAVKVLFQQRRIVEVVPYSKSTTTIEMPAKWDDNEVTRLLQRYQDQPAVLSNAVSSIKTRMVMNQDLKTAQKRLKLIASVIELFKLNQALQGILYDIHLAEKDFEIRQVEADTRLEDAQARRRSENRLRDLRAQRDELQLQREITELRRDTESIGRSAKPEPQLTPEQQRAKRHAASEARLESLKAQKQEALKIQDPDERVQKVNAIDDEIQRELQGEWRSSL